MGRTDLIGTGERHLVPPAGAEPGPDWDRKRMVPGGSPVTEREVGKRGPGNARGGAGGRDKVQVRVERAPAAVVTASTKARPSILDTIKGKPKAGRK